MEQRDSIPVITDPCDTSEENASNGKCLEIAQPLSKRQLKKQRKLLEWESKKKKIRLAEREKNRQKRKELTAQGLPVRNGPSRKALKKNRMDDSKNPISVVIDLDFDDSMIDKDVCKCAKQLLRVYTTNRKSPSPIHLHYMGLKSGGRIQNVLEKHNGYENWDVKITNDSYTTLRDKDKIIYLTSDSDNVLTELESDAVYVIGGLVDHNHHKGLTLDLATQAGVRHARLPLSEHIEIKTRTVLTIVHGDYTFN